MPRSDVKRAAPAGDIVKAIYESVKVLFNDDADEETLKVAYEKAKADRKAADADFVDAVREARS